MEYYHVVIETQVEGNSKRNHLVSLDKTEIEVRHLAESLTEKSEFLLERERIYPQHVQKVTLYRTAKPAAELTLPNGRSIADYKKSECKPVGCCKHRYIARCLSKGKVTEANDCTKEFMIGKRKKR